MVGSSLFPKMEKWPKWPLVVSCYHSLSLVVPLIVVRCHLLSFVVYLVVSLALTRCHSFYHLLSLVVTRCITCLSYYKQSSLSHYSVCARRSVNFNRFIKKCLCQKTCSQRQNNFYIQEVLMTFTQYLNIMIKSEFVKHHTGNYFPF